MPLNLLFYHFGRDLFDVVRVARDLTLSIWQILEFVLYLVGEERVQLVVSHYFFIILRHAQFLCPVPSLDACLANQVLRRRPVPPLDESVSFFDFNEITVLPRPVLVEAVIVLDIIYVNLLVFQHALEH